MITYERNMEHYKERCGGKGTMHIERLLPPELLREHVAMYAKVTIDVASSLGWHVHSGDNECYYILSGKARYNDNGSEVELRVGACTFTKDGQGHAIENIGNEPLVFMAMILK